MKTLIRNIAITLSAFAFMGCSKFDDINTSPDTSTQVKSSLLATGAIAGIVIGAVVVISGIIGVIIYFKYK